MNREELIDELTKLEIQEKAYKRALDVTYFNNDKRTKNFADLKKVQKQIQLVKYKLRILKEMHKNDNRNTTKSSN